MDNSFIDLGISPLILKALEEMGFEEPTEVQSRAIPHILNGEDLIVMSKTGSGKTAVFGVPMLQLTDCAASEPQGLILTPTRELAVQIDNDIKKYSKHLRHKTTAVYGQHSMSLEVQNLVKGTSIVTGTPGRVYDHIQQGTLKTKGIRFLVLDEADRMLDMGFLDQVVKIIKYIPKERVTLLFSATMPPEMHRICRSYMKNPVTIEIESPTMTVDTIRQVYYRVNFNEKNTQLNRLLLLERPASCIVFCNTRSAVDRVQIFLSRKGYSCQSLHGDIPQAKRLKTIQQFKQGGFPLLVATDVAARGIHVDSLSLVVNYDVPMDRDNYVHRIGRTGRAGNEGRAVSLVTSEDIMSLYEIEEHIGVMIAEEDLPSDAVLNEQKAQSEEWFKSVSQRTGAVTHSYSEKSMKKNHRKTSRPASASNTEGVKSKPSYEKHKQPAGKISTAKAEGSRPSNTGKNAYTALPAQSGIDSRAASGKVIRSRTVSTKGHKEAAVQTSQVRSAKARNTYDTAKKPLLNRILQRLFGK
ncbi:superfamily II DNA/RNA helicase [Ruminiclostridium sufflavum DSM 19573]|uniref:Superfamily II DNA/RNA helicase n=1 Tax=Ruminiclostridium sufflavum DSM 19573 TaxID=1121337 RepID=A0A318XU67_9FIRM|nr:DEAD/DEAH box helicase [Ruminiclostridium sufflavum]PYG90180.1 superfamily II DNA/RNA helicase [Ruminiclostridium sufflavum DSM 19573]